MLGNSSFRLDFYIKRDVIPINVRYNFTFHGYHFVYNWLASLSINAFTKPPFPFPDIHVKPSKSFSFKSRAVFSFPFNDGSSGEFYFSFRRNDILQKKAGS